MTTRRIAGWVALGCLGLAGAFATAPSDASGPPARLPTVLATYQEEPSLSERFDELEKRFDEQQETIDDLKSELKAAAVSGNGKAAIEISGRMQLDYWTHPGTDPGINVIETGDPAISPQNEFGFRRLRFGVGGDLPANMMYRIDMEFASGAEFRDAYFGWTDLPFVQELRIGNQKRPYGLDQWNSSRYNVFLERPFGNDAFNQDVRRLGIQSWSFSEDLAFNWQYGVFNQRNVQDEGGYISDHLQPEYAGRFAHTWWYDETSDGRGYAHWAISGTLAHPDGSAGTDPDPIGSDRAQNEARFRARPSARTISRWLDTDRIDGADWYELLGLESVWNFGPLHLVGEYHHVWLQRDPGFGRDLYFHGGYVSAAYFLTGDHMSWDRESGQLARPVPWENFFLVERCRGGIGGGLGAWQVALRYDYLDLVDDNIVGGLGRAVTLGLNWYWTAYARWQFNYVLGEIKHHRLDADNPASPIVGGDYAIFGTRMSVDF